MRAKARVIYSGFHVRRTKNARRLTGQISDMLVLTYTGTLNCTYIKLIYVKVIYKEPYGGETIRFAFKSTVAFVVKP